MKKPLSLEPFEHKSVERIRSAFGKLSKEKKREKKKWGKALFHVT